MNKEERFFENRIRELSESCYQKGIYTYSDFLNLYEQHIFNTMSDDLPPISFSLVGGNLYAERKIIIFKPEEIYYDYQLPISILKIEPLHSKFSESLTHRDYLGAVLNLGIDRSKLGDILIKENTAYLYVIDNMAPFITEHLNRVKHTSVVCSGYPMEELSITPELKEITGTVNNIRLDAVISLAFGLSRNSIVSYISNAKVFVNGKLITSNGYTLKEGDCISVRGLGRCIYDQHLTITKKGRNMIKILKYV